MKCGGNMRGVEVRNGGIRWSAVLAGLRRRRACRALEAAYDAGCWVLGLSVAARVTGDLAGARHGARLAAAAVAVAALVAGSGLLAGLYRGRYRRGSLDEALGVSRAAGVTALALAVAGRVLVAGQRAPLATIAAGAAAALLAMVGARYLVAAIRQSPPWLASAAAAARAGAPGARVIVFGAGEAGTALIRSLIRQRDGHYLPVALLDDDPDKRRLRVCGVPVLGDRHDLADVARRTGATILVIAIARASGSVIRELTRAAEQCGLVPKVVPSAAELLSGGARIEGVRDPRITDLLGRRPVQTDLPAIASHFAGRRILVTGAGGSIGSEICRQLHRLGPGELVMLDRDESALHAIELELHGRALLDSDLTVLADIRDPARIRQVFDRCRPEIVFHAAALKHLPLLQRYPGEAVKSNVWGTLTVLKAAAGCGASAFVNISTDKAADPTSVLGYSKRLAERLTAEYAARTGARYLSVRFGNVLGSRGSVLTALSAQAAAGARLTVTHPEVSRYFMTADEAVQLVLQAAVLGRPGEALVLDMGEQVKIVDIARRIAANAPERVEIVFTGLRPGEKLAESLLAADEVDERPYHPLIRHVSVPPIAPEAVEALDPAMPCERLVAALRRSSAGSRAGGPAAGADLAAASLAMLRPTPGGRADRTGHRAGRP